MGEFEPEFVKGLGLCPLRCDEDDTDVTRDKVSVEWWTGRTCNDVAVVAVAVAVAVTGLKFAATPELTVTTGDE
jgi:hypothetical protein